MADEFGRRVGATPAFRRVQIGDRPSASEQNRITEAIRQLYAQIAPYARQIGVELIRMSQTVGPQEDEMSEFHKRSAVVQYYDPDQNVFLENSQETKEVTDPMGLVWDEDEIVPALYHHQSGQYLPLNVRTVRSAITWPMPDGVYPSKPANKYPIKFVRFEYDDLGPKLQTPTRVFLDSQSTTPGSNDPDDYVLNINKKASEAYIGSYTPIQVFNQIGRNGDQQWFTNYCCSDDQSSTNSESNSISDSGSQSASESQSISQSESESQSESQSLSLSQSVSASASGSVSGSASVSGSVSASQSVSGSASGSVSASQSVSGSASGSVSASQSASGSVSGSMSGSMSVPLSGSMSAQSGSLLSASDFHPPGSCWGNCVYQWNGSTWTQLSFCYESEPVECYSCGPGSDGTYPGEVFSQPCDAPPL